MHPQVNELVGDFTTLTLLEMKNDSKATFRKGKNDSESVDARFRTYSVQCCRISA